MPASQVAYCVCTSGDAGGFDDTPRDRMGPLREAEQRPPPRPLGVHDLRFLRYPDGRVTPSIELRRDISREIRRCARPGPHPVTRRSAGTGWAPRTPTTARSARRRSRRSTPMHATRSPTRNCSPTRASRPGRCRALDHVRAARSAQHVVDVTNDVRPEVRRAPRPRLPDRALDESGAARPRLRRSDWRPASDSPRDTSGRCSRSSRSDERSIPVDERRRPFGWSTARLRPSGASGRQSPVEDCAQWLIVEVPVRGSPSSRSRS